MKGKYISIGGLMRNDLVTFCKDKELMEPIDNFKNLQSKRLFFRSIRARIYMKIALGYINCFSISRIYCLLN